GGDDAGEAHRPGHDEEEFGAGSRVVLTRRVRTRRGRVEPADVRPDTNEDEGGGDVPADQDGQLPGDEPRGDERGDDTARDRLDDPAAPGDGSGRQFLRHWRTARKVNTTMMITHVMAKRVNAVDRCTWLTL